MGLLKTIKIEKVITETVKTECFRRMKDYNTKSMADQATDRQASQVYSCVGAMWKKSLKMWEFAQSCQELRNWKIK